MVFHPHEWDNHKAECKEGNANKKRHEYASLLKPLLDQQHPAYGVDTQLNPQGAVCAKRGSHSLEEQKLRTRQCELAAHVQRLPKESKRLIVSPQESSRTAEGCRFACEERLPAMPQKHRVQQRNADRPHNGKNERGPFHVVVLVRATIQSQIVPKITPRLECVVLERIT
eukprot:2314119-Prymnesium_polylepis.1